jgi:YVTN family beta-propeller protein
MRFAGFLVATFALSTPLREVSVESSATLKVNRAPLSVEAKIPLGDVKGRLDHLAFDPRRQHLYVAELGNNSVGIVDLAARGVVRTVGGFHEPQGIGYEPTTDAIYVASGGDGAVRVFRGEDFSALGEIALGEDADNVRVDKQAQRIYVGYGDGALAVIDASTRRKVADISLKGHPESFQLDTAGDLIFVNVPDAGQIAVVARNAQRQVSSWPTGKLHANYPLALDPSKGRVISIFRHPARLEAFDERSGRNLGGIDVCGDSDDVFVDSKRQRLYVVCGEGSVDVFASSGEAYTRIGRLTTSAGSRTGLFVPELDRLLIAIRASGKEAAAIWILRPDP